MPRSGSATASGRPKVFGIGFHKTGTSSLAEALRILGYRVTGPNEVDREGMDHDVAWRVARELVPRYDAFQDNPWPLLFRELDREVPGARFVLTRRSDDAWLRSIVGHFDQKRTPMREWIYGVGSPLGNEDVYLERYRRHNRDVLAYFADRPGDLLVMDVSRGDGWEVLCPFLELPAPHRPFPHVNAASARSDLRPTARLRRGLSSLLERGAGGL